MIQSFFFDNIFFLFHRKGTEVICVSLLYSIMPSWEGMMARQNTNKKKILQIVGGEDFLI